MAEPIIFDKTHKAESNHLTISPVSRLDGHAKIEIFLDDAGNVDEAYFQVVELRGFEEFCKGRPVEEMPRIVTALCGICPWAHHLASSKVLDMIFDADPPRAAHMLREAAYAAHIVHTHILHFYALAAPDFVLGPGSPVATRNVVGLIGAVGVDLVKEVLHQRCLAQKIQEIIGGRATHPVFGLPGGISKPLTKEQQKEILELSKDFIPFAKKTIDIFNQIVLGNKAYVDIITNKDLYQCDSYHMGMVDDKNHMNFYWGKCRVMDQQGKEVAKFAAENYLEYIGEQVLPWSYLKFPYLKKVGWNGITDGPKSGLVRVAPLSRINVSDGMATPLANAEWDRFMKTLGGRPVQFSLANHWARLIELLYAAERLQELMTDKDILDPNVRTMPKGNKKVGYGTIEAGRGTIVHHYECDDNGYVTKANMIVATAFNHGAICHETTKTAKAFIKNGQVSDGIFNLIEMVFRSYDPCFSCATHSLPGSMPMEIELKTRDGNVIQTLSNR